MKKLALLLVAAFIVTLFTVSCSKKKDDNTTSPKTYSELIVGRWKTADGGHYEVYDANGTGHMWDPADDVQEDEADTFTWSFDSNNKLTQIITYQSGAGVIPQYCNILILNETTLKYNNDGWRAEYTLTKVN
ncbi:MAG: hypothetical protein J6T53_04505 [Bacteroidales bacterium]|nr:hypothetical protein [Bacteroidales bacterium]